MLSMNAIHDVNYYSELAKEDYYTCGGEPAGIWAGLGARHLSLQNQVSQQSYHNIFRGYCPKGNALCEAPGGKHRHGWDLTFSAPKSVSILWARADESTRQAIQKSQQEAVIAAVTFLERHAAFTRRGSGGLIKEGVAGLVAATFEHSTSRAQDPQLHTHCLIANVAPRHDGSWGTLESRHFFLWQKAAGAVYRSSLANQLRELGFGIEEVEGEQHFEIQGIPRRICEAFSKRAKAISEALESRGISSSASKAGDAVKLTTREYKQAVDRPALFRQWQDELDDLGLTANQVVRMQSTHLHELPQPLPLDSIIDQLVEKQAVFRLQDVYSNVAIQGQFHQVSLSDIESAVSTLIGDDRLVELGTDKSNNRLFTTKSMLEIEQELIQHADYLNKQATFQLPEKAILTAIAKQETSQGYTLSEEQQEAVFTVCQSGLDILQGAAGAGKSTSMKAVRIAYQASGFKVRGATVARKAAIQLEDETDIPSTTVAMLLKELDSSKSKLTNNVVILDEAGQLSSPDLLRLTKAVSQAGGKLILVGEQQQLDAINHGGVLRFLSDRQGCSRIQVIRRQRAAWAREAVQHFRAGDAEKALALHNKQGQVHILDDAEQTRVELIKSWDQYTTNNPEKQTAILAQRWRDVKPLCNLARQVYQSRGMVGGENITVECAVGNQQLMFDFSRGERVRFTRNDYKRGFTNGVQGTVKSVRECSDDVHFEVELDDGKSVTFKRSEYSDDQGRLYLVQAYASTVYSSQGMTVDGDVFIHYSSGMARAATYVAGSRHKDNCHWFVNGEDLDLLSSENTAKVGKKAYRLDTLSKRMSDTQTISMATEYLNARTREINSKYIKPEKFIINQKHQPMMDDSHV